MKKQTKNKSLIARNKDILSVFVVTAAILMVPLVAMQFTSQVKWDLLDFVTMGTLLIGMGLLMVLASRKIKKMSHRVAVIAALLVVLLLIYVQLAVGVVDLPFSGH